jgi:acetylglutamate kinase
VNPAAIDYGFAGDVDRVNIGFLSSMIQQGITPVIAPITHDHKGQLLNTNADTIAQETARAMAADFEVKLVYCFEKPGVLSNADDNNSVIKKINPTSYKDLKETNQVYAGMIPKLDNAFTALASGVRTVLIGKAEEIEELVKGEKGTSIVNE